MVRAVTLAALAGAALLAPPARAADVIEGIQNFFWQRSASSGIALGRSQGVVVANDTYLLFASGAAASGANAPDSTLYDISAGSVRGSQAVSFPTAGRVGLRFAATATVHDDSFGLTAAKDFAIVYGGQNDAGAATTELFLLSSQGRYSLVTTATGTPPVARVGAAGVFLPTCSNSSTVDVGGPACFIAHGGRTAAQALLADGEVLTINGLATATFPAYAFDWQRPAQLGGGAGVPNAPSPRHSHSAVAHIDGRQALVFGGMTAAGPSPALFGLAPGGFLDATSDEMTNVALGKTVTASSTDATQSAPIAAVVDGNTNTNHNPSATAGAGFNNCFQTSRNQTAGTFPVVTINLGAPTKFDRVRWYERTDCAIGNPDSAAQTACLMAGLGFQLYVGSSATYGAASNTRCVWPDVVGPIGGVADVPCAAAAAQYVHLVIPNGVNRTITACEIQVLATTPWQWRQYGSRNAELARGTRATGTSVPANALAGAGGPFMDAAAAIDGVATNDARSGSCFTTQSSVTSAAGVQPGLRQQLLIDLMASYPLNSVYVWPMLFGPGAGAPVPANRTKNVLVYAGKSAFSVDQNVFCGVFDLSAVTPAGAGAALGACAGQGACVGAVVTTGACAGVEARFVMIQKVAGYPYVAAGLPAAYDSWDDTVSVCEVQVYGASQRDMPTGRYGHAAAGFKGQMVIFGGIDATGSLLSDVRFYDMLLGTWNHPEILGPTGTPPTPRAYASMIPILTDNMAVVGGAGAGTLNNDVVLLRTPACATTLTAPYGVQSSRCHHLNSACNYVCSAGFVPANPGSAGVRAGWVVCLPDGTLYGNWPPCVSTPGQYQATQAGLITASPAAGPGTATVLVPHAYINGVQALNNGLAGLVRVRTALAPAYGVLEDFSIAAPAAALADLSSRWTFQDLTAVPVSGLPGISELALSVGELRIGAGAGASCVSGRCPALKLNTWPAQLGAAWAFEANVRLSPESETFPGYVGGIGLWCTNTAKCVNPAGAAGGTLQVSLGVQLNAAGATEIVWRSNARATFATIVAPPFASSGNYNPTGRSVYLRIECAPRNKGGYEAFWRVRPTEPWIALPGVALLAVDFTPSLLTTELTAAVFTDNQRTVVSTVVGASSVMYTDFYYIRLEILACPSAGSVAVVPFTTACTTLVTCPPVVISGLTPGVPYVFVVSASNTGGATWGPEVQSTSTFTPTAAPTVPLAGGTVEVALRRPSFFLNPGALSTAPASLANDGNVNSTLFGGASSSTYQCARSNPGFLFNGQVSPALGFAWYVDLGYTTDIVNVTIFGSSTYPEWLGGYTIHLSPTTDWLDGVECDDSVNGYNYNITFAPSFSTNVPCVASGRYLFVRVPVVPTASSLLPATGYSSLILCEVQAFAANLCPARPSTNAVVQPGSVCSGPGAVRGALCAMTCPNGMIAVAGEPSAYCQGSVWSAPPLVCQPTCDGVPMPPNTARCETTVLRDSFADSPTLDYLAGRYPPLDPRQAWGQTWFVDYALNKIRASARPGCGADMVLTVAKNTGSFSDFDLTAAVSTRNKAGISFLVQDTDNYYVFGMDVVHNIMFMDAVVGGEYTRLGDYDMAGFLQADVEYKLTVRIVGAVFQGFLAPLNAAAGPAAYDGWLVIEAADSRLDTGRPGLYAYTDGTFDELELSQPCAGACVGLTPQSTVTGDVCTMACKVGYQVTAGSNVQTCLFVNVSGTLVPQMNLPPPTCTLIPPVFRSEAVSCSEGLPVDAPCGAPLEGTLQSPASSLAFLITGPPGQPFYIAQCSGQLFVANATAMDATLFPPVAAGSFALTIRAFPLEDPTNAALWTNATIRVYLTPLARAPVVAASTFNLTENALPGTFVGALSVVSASPVTFAIAADFALGRFAVDATGRVTVALTNSQPLDFEASPNSFQLAVRATTTGVTPALVGAATVTIALTDADDVPALDPTMLLTQTETAAQALTPFAQTLADTVRPAWTDQDATSAFPAFRAAPNFALIPPSVQDAVCTPAALGGRALNRFLRATIDGDANTSALFAVGAVTGVVNIVNTPTLPWTSPARTSTVVYGTAVFGVYDICVNVTSGPLASARVWSLQAVHLGIVADLTSRASVPGCTGPAFLSVTGGSVVSCTLLNWPAQHLLNATFGDGITAYTIACPVNAAGTAFNCTTPAGTGAPMTWNFYDVGTAAVPAAPTVVVTSTAVTFSYAAPTFVSIANATAMRTTGGSVIHITGTNFGVGNGGVTAGTSVIVVSLGPSALGAAGSTVPCAYMPAGTPGSRSSPTVISCTVGAGSGANLAVRVVVSGQVMVAGSGGPSTGLPTASYAPPIITYAYRAPLNVSAFGVDALSVGGGEVISFAGSGFGPGTQTWETITATFGGLTGTTTPFVGCARSAVTPDALVTCTMPAGSGTNLKFVVSATGQASTATGSAGTPANGQGLSYATPIITSVYGPGTAGGPTAGGAVVYIEGTGFGPITVGGPTGATTITSVLYGPTAVTDQPFAAASCYVDQAPPLTPRITCLAAPGTGPQRAWTVSISGSPTNVFTCTTCSYAAPIVSAVTFLPSSLGLATTGGGTINIDGLFFGPATAYTNSRLVVWMGVRNFGPAPATPISFAVTGCTVAIAQTRITCTPSPPGVGAGLTVRLSVNGVFQGDPSANYVAPTISGVFAADGVTPLATQADPNKALTVVVTGSGFGVPYRAYNFFPTTGLSNTTTDSVVAVNFGPTASEYAAAIVAHAADTAITVALGPNSGSGFRSLLPFRLTAGNQPSAVSTVGVTYAPIVIKPAFTGNGAPTYGPDFAPNIVTLQASGVPLLDPAYTLVVLLGSQPANTVVLSPIVPSTTAGLADFVNPDGSYNVQFELPQFFLGYSMPIKLGLQPRSSLTAASVVLLVVGGSGFPTYSYAPPTVANLVVTRPAWFLNASLPCPFAASDPVFKCNNTNIQQVVVLGANFGAGPAEADPLAVDGCARTVEGQVNATGVWSPAVLWQNAAGWSNARLVTYTTAAAGTVRVSLSCPGVGAFPVVAKSNFLAFQTQHPSIGSITGATTGVPTAGGLAAVPRLVLTLQVDSLARADAIRVLVGVGNGTAAQLVLDDAGLLPVTDSGLQVINTQPGPYWTVKFIPPPGQGLNQPVRVERNTRGAIDITDVTVTLSYAAPNTASYSVQQPDGTWRAFPYSPISPVRVPTAGARMRVNGTNLGTAPVVYLADSWILPSANASAPVECAGSAGTHTCYEFSAPPGEGSGVNWPQFTPAGYYIGLVAGGQDPLPGYMGFAYNTPVVTGVTVVGGAVPTAGNNVTLVLTGVDFGVTNRFRDRGLSTVAVSFGLPGEAVGNFAVCRNVTRVNQTCITCALPEGSGANLIFRVFVLDQAGFSSPGFSYNAPVITEAFAVSVILPTTPPDCYNVTRETWDPDAQRPTIIVTTTCTPYPNPPAPILPAQYDSRLWRFTGVPGAGPAPPLPSLSVWRVTGGAAGASLVLRGTPDARSTLIVLFGRNFGPANALNCPMLAWTYRPAGMPAFSCNNGEDFLGEGEIPAGNILYWSHTLVAFYAQPGLGFKDVEVSARGQTAGDAAGVPWPLTSPNKVRLQFDAPAIYNIAPSVVDTDGISPVVILATNLGPVARDLTLLSNQYNGPVFSPPIPLADAPTLPTAYLVVQLGRTCISNAQIVTGGSQPNVANCYQGITQRRGDLIQFTAPPGVGFNKLLVVNVVDASAPAYAVDAKAWVLWSAAPADAWLALNAPAVLALPDRQAGMPVAQVYGGSGGTIAYIPPVVLHPVPSLLAVDAGSALRTVTLSGSGFGDGTVADRDLWRLDDRELFVWVGGVPCVTVNRIRTGLTGGLGTAIECVVDSALVGAGYQRIDVRVAGQTMPYRLRSAYTDVLITCAVGYFARAPPGFVSGGETCAQCPAQGAVCNGYDNRLPVFTDRFTYPTILPGWYNLNGSMASACPGGSVYPGRDVCVVPCQRAASCLGQNWCAPGYVSVAPAYACATCDKGYYSRGGTCFKCFASANVFLIAYTVLAVLLLAIAYASAASLTGIWIGMLPLGLDFVQQLAMLAYSRIAWADSVTTMFHAFSTFYFNVDLVAPECTLGSAVPYANKLYFVAILPLAVLVLLLAAQVVSMVLKKLSLVGVRARRSMRAELLGSAPTFISATLMLWSLLYLYEVETMLQPFNCAPTNPATYDNNGGMQFFLQVERVLCYVSGGAQAKLVPYAIVGNIVYTAGYPIAVACFFYAKREAIMEDQLLRAKGVGHDKLTGPRTHLLRAAFSTLYFNFMPDFFYWQSVVLLRRFLFMFVMLRAFNRNGSYQMAACLLVLVVFYALHVRAQPYMGPGRHEDALRAHTVACMSVGVHARLRAAIAAVEARGRRRAHKNLLDFDGSLQRRALLPVLSSWALEYNSVEAALLFCQIVVVLMAIIQDRNDSSAYPQTGAAAENVIIVVVAITLIYYVTVAVIDALMVRAEQLRAAATAARFSPKAKKSAADEADEEGGGARKAGRRSFSEAAADALAARLGDAPAGDAARRASVAAAPVESALNPMFAALSGAASASNRNLAERAAKEGAAASPRAGAGAGAPGAGTGAAAALSDADFGDLAATLTEMSTPPPPAVWASMRSTLADVVTSSLSLRAELAAAKREIAAAAAVASSRNVLRPTSRGSKVAFSATRTTDDAADGGAGAGY